MELTGTDFTETEGYFRGYKIDKVNSEWVFRDNAKSVAESWDSRPCGNCNLFNTPEGYDGCLKHIPNALNACCGHGNENEAYIQFEDINTKRKRS